MTTHAKLSPSKRHRWGACAASVREEAKYPEDRSGKAAIDGTHSHTLLEKCLTEKMSPFHYVDQTLSDGDGEFVVDQTRAERVNFAMDYITKRVIELNANVEVISEMEVNPFPIFFRDDLSGHVDVQIVGDDYLEIIDYKDGMGEVNAEGNPQLEQYAFGALCAHQDKDFKTIRMTIIQPKLREKGCQGVVWAQYSYDTLMLKVDTLAAQAAACDVPDAPFNPGESQCKYCRAKGGCSALTNKALEASGITFANLDVATQAAGKDAAEMSDEKIVEIMEAAPLIRQMLEGVEAEAQRRLEAGKDITGLKLVRGNGSRDWTVDEPTLLGILKKAGVPQDECYTHKLVSPAQAEKLRWKKRDGTECTLSDKHRVMLQTEYIKKSEGKLTIALASDKRPAVILGAAEMFNSVELPDFLKPL
jgi:hypothetical protein